MNLKTLPFYFAAASVIVVLNGCAVTEDSLKASSETLHNTSEASSDFTSSTSHKDKEDRKVRDVHEFSATNFEQLREDMAVGNGPHLASLATLLAIPERDRAAFYRLAKSRFTYLYRSHKTSATQMLARLDSSMRTEPRLAAYSAQLRTR